MLSSSVALIKSKNIEVKLQASNREMWYQHWSQFAEKMCSIDSVTRINETIAYVYFHLLSRLGCCCLPYENDFPQLFPIILTLGSDIDGLTHEGQVHWGHALIQWMRRIANFCAICWISTCVCLAPQLVFYINWIYPTLPTEQEG